MKTKLVHCKKAKFDVYIGRPTVWGNPYKIGRDGDRKQVIMKYKNWLLSQPELVERAKQELSGKVLGCWCSPSLCHGDVLLGVVEGNLVVQEPRPASNRVNDQTTDEAIEAVRKKLGEDPKFREQLVLALQ